MRTTDLRDLLKREPFNPFDVVMSSGKTYTVKSPDTAVALKSDLFIALDDGERWVLCPYLHIAAIESASNGGKSRRRKRRE